MIPRSQMSGLAISPATEPKMTDRRWRKIESAPRDGRKILLADYSGYTERGDDGMWIASGYWSVTPLARDEGYWTDGVERLYTPTHWQPLLELPNV